MVEYALILALVSVAGIALLTAIGGSISGVFSKVNADFNL
jgi:Flp pilus assembly pilin Flp